MCVDSVQIGSALGFAFSLGVIVGLWRARRTFLKIIEDEQKS